MRVNPFGTAPTFLGDKVFGISEGYFLQFVVHEGNINT